MKIKKIKINRPRLYFGPIDLMIGRRVICSENDELLFNKIMDLKKLDISEDASKNPQILILEFEACSDPECYKKVCESCEPAAEEPAAEEPAAEEPAAEEPAAEEPAAEEPAAEEPAAEEPKRRRRGRQRQSPQ
jgi:hypothetical protein